MKAKTLFLCLTTLLTFSACNQNSNEIEITDDFGKEAINLASDLEEVQNVVDVAFGDMSYKIEQFSKTAIQQLGISELSAKRTASTYMAMGKGMGIAQESASNIVNISAHILNRKSKIILTEKQLNSIISESIKRCFKKINENI